MANIVNMVYRVALMFFVTIPLILGNWADCREKSRRRRKPDTKTVISVRARHETGKIKNIKKIKSIKKLYVLTAYCVNQAISYVIKLHIYVIEKTDSSQYDMQIIQILQIYCYFNDLTEIYRHCASIYNGKLPLEGVLTKRPFKFFTNFRLFFEFQDLKLDKTVQMTQKIYKFGISAEKTI